MHTKVIIKSDNAIPFGGIFYALGECFAVVVEVEAQVVMARAAEAQRRNMERYGTIMRHKDWVVLVLYRSILIYLAKSGTERAHLARNK